ncbi:YegP family protein [Hansschlegelia beijingensis]|uniref:DUF1508 domain-containing protein n=1 Tax=Hansschlegelia beijingensis TaxID=1133344 RepID=A0A7W6CZU5_9HYPH|nr:DUF1508 domain-containing protein [Hansschlegelia beijingensis]MBB3974140.1 hypothetical protein [Hansschlegelia beijingensis]
MAKFKIKKSGDNQYYWVFVADNGQTICVTETYTSKQSAKNAIDVVKAKAADAGTDDET